MTHVPSSLKKWFIVHFWADMLFVVPLFIAPIYTLTTFGFTAIDPLIARLVAAAFLAIGGTSLIVKNKGPETFSALLTLKIIWSSSAIIATLLAIRSGTTPFAWAILAIYLVFFSAWVYYKRRI